MPQFSKFVSLSVLFCALFNSNVMADTQKPFSDPEKTIIVSARTPEFTITLPSNPTTGFMWFAKPNATMLLTIVKHTYRPPLSQIVGASGMDVWTLRVNPAAFTAPQILTIEMVYARPWQVQASSKEQEFTIATQSSSS